MAWKDWAAGNQPTESEFQDYIQDQTIIRCTSTTRPPAANCTDGMIIHELDTDLYFEWEGAPITGAFASWPVSEKTAGSNLLRSGDFRVWQRGDSVGYGAGYGYTADGWRTYGSGSGLTASKLSAGGGIRLTRATGSTAVQGVLTQALETLDSSQLAGKRISVSGLMRVSSASGCSNLELRITTGSGVDEAATGVTGTTTWTGATVVINTPIWQNGSPRDAWLPFAVSVAVPAGTSQLGIALWQNYAGTAIANDNVDFDQVKLEVGRRATPYQARPYAEELATCQRFLRPLPTFSLVGAAQTANYFILRADLSEMRATPTITIPAGPYTNSIVTHNVATFTPTSVSVDSATKVALTIVASGLSGLTVGQMASWFDSRPILASAEL